MKTTKDRNRRVFLKHALTGTVVALGAAALNRPAASRPASVGNRPDEILYHESEDFQKYYKTLKS